MKPISRQDIENLLNPLPHRMRVEFSLYCCLDVKANLKADDKASLECLDLVQRWLEGDASVTAKALADAAYVTHRNAYSAHSAHSAAYSAHSAAYSAHSAHSAYSAHSATYDAYSAAHSAYNAAYSASDYDNKVYEDKMKQYYSHLLGMIKSLTELEREIFSINL